MCENIPLHWIKFLQSQTGSHTHRHRGKQWSFKRPLVRLWTFGTLSPFCSPGTNSDGVKTASLAPLLKPRTAHGAEVGVLWWAAAPAKPVKTSLRTARCVCVDIMFEGRRQFPHVSERIAPLYAHGALTQFGRMAWREARSVRQDESRSCYSSATDRWTKHTVEEKKMLLECNFFVCVEETQFQNC